MITDRIEKKTLLNAPLQRVWEAISDAEQFGFWFGVTLDGPFTPGARLSGTVTPTRVDAETAEAQKQYEGMVFEIHVERVEPIRRLSFRWHPGEEEPDVDDSGEQMTLVIFELEDTHEGTLLTITESGFDRIPPERRARAFTANDTGWTIQLRMIRKYLALRSNS